MFFWLIKPIAGFGVSLYDNCPSILNCTHHPLVCVTEKTCDNGYECNNNSYNCIGTSFKCGWFIGDCYPINCATFECTDHICENGPYLCEELGWCSTQTCPSDYTPSDDNCIGQFNCGTVTCNDFKGACIGTTCQSSFNI